MPFKKRRGQREIHRQGGHVKTEAETGVILLQAKEHQEPPEAGRGKEGFSPVGFRGSMALEYLNFGLLASRTVREEISVVINHQVVVTCYSSPKKLIK